MRWGGLGRWGLLAGELDVNFSWLGLNWCVYCVPSLLLASDGILIVCLDWALIIICVCVCVCKICISRGKERCFLWACLSMIAVAPLFSLIGPFFLFSFLLLFLRALSWFAVGCYYYCIKKYDQSRRYFR